MKAFLTLLLISFSAYSFAQKTAIPSQAFENYLITQAYDDVLDGYILNSSAALVTSIEITDSAIHSLAGLEAFVNLTELRCSAYNVRLDSLDVSQNTKLELLDCGNNYLGELNVSNCLNLKYLYCDYNSLQYLDISKNTNLIELDCHRNSLTEINITNNLKLEKLICHNNKLTDINFSKSYNLLYLDCGYNSFKSINFSGCMSLTYLDFGNNKNIVDFNVSNLITLENLRVSNLPVSTIDLSKNTNLVHFDAWFCLLDSLDFSHNQKLIDIQFVEAFKLQKLTLENHPELKNIMIGNCAFSSINLSECPKLTNLSLYSTPTLTSIDVSKCPLTFLSFGGNGISTIDLSKNTDLVNVILDDNANLYAINLQNGTNEAIKTINLRKLPKLQCFIVDSPTYSETNWVNQVDYFTYEPIINDSHFTYSTSKCDVFEITPTVYFDENNNCKKDEGEKVIPGVPIKFKETFNFDVSSANDTISFFVPNTGTYTVYLDPNEQHNFIENICNNNEFVIDVTTNTSPYILDIGVTIQDTSIFTVNITKDRMRRCFESKTFIDVYNEGVEANDCNKLYVDFSEHLSIVSASEDYTVIDEDAQIIAFDLSEQASFSHKNFEIIDMVNCGNEDIRGYTQCIKTWVAYDQTCLQKEPITYNESTIQVLQHVECMNDTTVEFTIINQGNGDMQKPSEYRIYYNNKLAHTASFQLKSGESLIVNTQADGSTIRLEADQLDGFPTLSRPRSTVEGCGSFTPAEADLGYWPNSALDNLDSYVDEVCMSISDSYDPNDKQVFPSGIANENFVNEDEAQTYKIRFQNTGSDEAYNIVIKDTLSEFLDLQTFEIKGASHKYTYKIENEGAHVLTVTFNNINLPDSTTNELESHGFISYKISPIKDIKPFTEIKNTAYIYFDFNSAIKTNTTFVTAKDTIIESSKNITVEEISTALQNVEQLIKMSIYPNPSEQFINITSESNIQLIEIYNLQQQLIKSETCYSNKETINISDLTSGNFIIRVHTIMGIKSFKLIKK